MYKPLLLLGLLGLASACGRVEVKDEPIASRSAAAPTTSTSVTPAPQPSAGPSSTSATASPTTRRVPPTTTARPATTTATPVTTATTRPLSRAEATSRLCAGVASADQAIQRGSFVSGGLRLSSALGANAAVADPQVVTAARAMLRAGLNADPEGYVTARGAASSACSQAGFPINLSGPIQCIQDPCP